MFQLFLDLRRVFEWDDVKKTVVGLPAYSGPQGTVPATARRRAPRAKVNG
jgi:hypothetical protein